MGIDDYRARVLGRGLKSSRNFKVSKLFREATHLVDILVPKASFRIEVDNELIENSLPVHPLTKEHLFQLMGIYSEKTSDKILAHSTLPETNGTFHSFVKNQFLACAFQAFNLHIGFVLSPSQLFLLILQQIALHVNANPEKLRNQFVQFEGKKELLVDIPAYPSVKQWARAIQEIREEIANNTVPDTYELLSMGGFSTASPTEHVAGEIALMDVCQSYFDYRFNTVCGIPFFILQGSVEDWELLREKAHQAILRKTLPELSSQWLPALIPTIDKIIKARKGEEVDLAFWNSFFKIGAVDGSGAYTFISGWVNNFFPLMASKKWNPFCLPLEANPIYREYIKPKEEEDKSEPDELYINQVNGMDKGKFPNGFSKVPAIWYRDGANITLHVHSGFVGGIYQNHSIFPQVGWWISESIDDTPNLLSTYLKKKIQQLRTYYSTV